MKHYSKEFKEEALKLSNEIGVKKAAQQLGIAYYTLADWRSIRRNTPPAKTLSAEEQTIRIRELERENAELRTANGNVKKCAVGKHPKSEKHGNTAQFSCVPLRSTSENCGGIGSGCRLRLRPLPVLHRRQPKRVARIDPNAVVVDKNIAENDRFDLFSR